MNQSYYITALPTKDAVGIKCLSFKSEKYILSSSIGSQIIDKSNIKLTCFERNFIFATKI